MANKFNLGLNLGQMLAGTMDKTNSQKGYQDAMKGFQIESDIDLNRAKIGETNSNTALNTRQFDLQSDKEFERSARLGQGFGDGDVIPADKMSDYHKLLGNMRFAVGAGNKSLDMQNVIRNVQRNNITADLTPQNAFQKALQVGVLEPNVNPLEIRKATLTDSIANSGAPNANENALLLSQGKAPFSNMGSDGTFNQITGTSTINPQAQKLKEVTPLTGTGKLNKALQTGEITQAQYDRELEKDLGGKPMSELQKQKQTTNMAKDFKTAGQSMQTMQEIVNSIATLRDSKGLGAREGYTGYFPAWAQGSNAMTAENRLNTLKGKVTQMGKAMATLSGAIGPMAVQEWKIVSDAVNAIDPTAGNFAEQLDNIEAQATGASARIKESYDNTHADNFEQNPNMTSDNIKIYPSTLGDKQGNILPRGAKMPVNDKTSNTNPPVAGAKTMTMRDVEATAKKSGKTTQQVIEAAKQKGYTVK